MINTIYKNSSISNNITVDPYIDELVRWEEAQKTHLGKLLAKPNYEIRHNFFSRAIITSKYNTIIK